MFLIVDAVKSLNFRRHSSQISYHSVPNFNSHRSDRRIGTIFKTLKITFSIFKFGVLLLFFCLILLFLLPFCFLFIIPILFLRMPTHTIAFEKVKQETDKYLNIAIPAIVSDWNHQELIRRASSNFLKSVEEKELQKIFALCAKTLGKLTCYQVSRECLKSGGAKDAPMQWWKFFQKMPEPTKWETILMNYQTVAIFEKGMANIEIQIVKERDRYSIESMNINIGSKPSQQSFRLGIATTLDALKHPNQP